MFRVIGGDILDKSGEKTLAVFDNRAEQTRPVALAREFDGGPRAARKPRSTRLDLYGFLG